MKITRYIIETKDKKYVVTNIGHKHLTEIAKMKKSNLPVLFHNEHTAKYSLESSTHGGYYSDNNEIKKPYWCTGNTEYSLDDFIIVKVILEFNL